MKKYQQPCRSLLTEFINHLKSFGSALLVTVSKIWVQTAIFIKLSLTLDECGVNIACRLIRADLSRCIHKIRSIVLVVATPSGRKQPCTASLVWLTRGSNFYQISSLAGGMATWLCAVVVQEFPAGLYPCTGMAAVTV